MRSPSIRAFMQSSDYSSTDAHRMRRPANIFAALLLRRLFARARRLRFGFGLRFDLRLSLRLDNPLDRLRVPLFRLYLGAGFEPLNDCGCEFLLGFRANKDPDVAALELVRGRIRASDELGKRLGRCGR